MDTARRCRALGLGLGAGAGFALTRTYLFDFAPVVLALCLGIGVLAGEAISRRPLGERLTATLRTRRVRDYLPMTPVVISLALVLVCVSWWFPIPDHPDHQVKYFGTAAPATLMTTWATLGAVAVLTLLAVWMVVRSPQAVSEGGGAAADEAWRRATVNHLVHAYAALSATIFTAAMLWYADAQMDWRGGGSPVWGVVVSLLAGLGLVAAAYYAGSLLLPHRLTDNDRVVAVGHS